MYFKGVSSPSVFFMRTTAHEINERRHTADIDPARAEYLEQLARERNRPEFHWRDVLLRRPEGGTQVEIRKVQ